MEPPSQHFSISSSVRYAGHPDGVSTQPSISAYGPVAGASIAPIRTRRSSACCKLPRPSLTGLTLRAAEPSQKLGIYLIFGFLEKAGDELFNSRAMFSPQGEVIARYSKRYAQPFSVIFAQDSGEWNSA